MTKEYSALRRFTSEGIELFQRVMTGQTDESALGLLDPRYTQPVEETLKFEVRDFETAREMAQEICKSFGDVSPQALAGDVGLWAWLTFALIDVLFPKSAA